MKKYDCPCCGGSSTIEEEIIGMFGRCEVCGWEDDGVQQKYPDDKGANGKWTLNSAKEAWANGKTLFERYPNPASEDE